MRDHLGNPFHSGRPEFAAGVLLLDDCEGSMTWIVSGTGGGGGPPRRRPPARPRPALPRRARPASQAPHHGLCRGR